MIRFEHIVSSGCETIGVRFSGNEIHTCFSSMSSNNYHNILHMNHINIYLMVQTDRESRSNYGLAHFPQNVNGSVV